MTFRAFLMNSHHTNTRYVNPGVPERGFDASGIPPAVSKVAILLFKIPRMVKMVSFNLCNGFRDTAERNMRYRNV